MAKYNIYVEDVSVEAVFNVIGGVKGAKRLLCGELEVVEKKIPTPNIALPKAYKLMGMEVEYEEAAGQFELLDDPSVWKVLMVKGLTFEKIIRAYQKAKVKLELFNVDLQKAINKEREQRDSDKGTYLVSFKRNVEADEENADQSANQREGLNDITLMERLIVGLAYFLGTGKHLDTKTYTLCAGSRHCSGYVPYVSFHADGGRVYVSWWHAGDRAPDFRARSVVSSVAEPSEAQAKQP